MNLHTMFTVGELYKYRNFAVSNREYKSFRLKQYSIQNHFFKDDFNLLSKKIWVATPSKPGQPCVIKTLTNTSINKKPKLLSFKEYR